MSLSLLLHVQLFTSIFVTTIESDANMVVSTVHMDPHSLSLPVVEGVMQREFFAADQEHIVEFSEPEKPLSGSQPVTSV